MLFPKEGNLGITGISPITISTKIYYTLLLKHIKPQIKEIL